MYLRNTGEICGIHCKANWRLNPQFLNSRANERLFPTSMIQHGDWFLNLAFLIYQLFLDIYFCPLMLPPNIMFPSFFNIYFLLNFLQYSINIIQY